MDNLANRLKAEREAKSLTQEALAKMVSKKKRQSLISNIEAGTYQSSPYLPEIAYALGLHAMWLKTGIGPKHIYPTAGESAATVLTTSEPPPLEIELMENVRKMDDRGLILLIDQAEQIARRHPREKKEAA